MAALCSLGKFEAKPEFTGVKTGCSESRTIRKDMEGTDIRLVRVRSGLNKKLKVICENHSKKWIKNYPGCYTKCCDPFVKHGKSEAVEDSADNQPTGTKRKRSASKARSLCEITLQMRDSAKHLGKLLVPGQKLCVGCKIILFSDFKRLKTDSGDKIITQNPSPASFSSQSTNQPPSEGAPGPSPGLDTSKGSKDSKGSDWKPAADIKDLDCLNNWLVSVGMEKISVRKLKRQKKYPIKVLDKIKSLMQKFSKDPLIAEVKDTEELQELSNNSDLYLEIIQQLQHFIASCKDKVAIVKALSVLPKSMSVAKIKAAFPSVKKHTIRRVKTLVAVKGILSSFDPKAGSRGLDQNTIACIKSFYYRMDISRELPGKKDVVSVVEDNKRVSKRKRLLLGTISKLHEVFLKEYPGTKVSVCKFAALRPKECVIAGSSGTHVVCVCTYHQNPKLMFNAAKLFNIEVLDTVSDCYKYFLCETPSEACHLRDCENCPSGIDLQQELELYFAEEMIESVTYNQWKTVDRGDLDTINRTSADFIDDFMNQIERLIPHSYIAKQQSSFYEDRMTNLQEGEVIVNADFSENYTFVSQDMSQASYFAQQQCTVHPFMCYCRHNGDIIKSSFIVISDHLQHNTSAFALFQVKLIDFLKATHGNLKRVYYFSDGSAAQYKNRYSVANTFFHEQDFGVPAEWHFFATSHGKCACDGLGGSVKRTAWLHSLRNTDPKKNILSAQELFKFSSEKSDTMNFAYVSTEEVLEHSKTLENRFQTASRMEGIQSRHAIIPSRRKFSVTLKTYSNAFTGEEKEISNTGSGMAFSDVRGFVVYANGIENKWQLGYVEDKDEESEDFEVTNLEPTVTKQSYEFTDAQQTVSLQDVLLLVEPNMFKRGQVYKLLAKDIKAADRLFRSWKDNQ